MAGRLLTIGGKFGDYTVVRLLGSGGMGAVYLIHGEASGCDYAVKILDPEIEKSDEEFKRRFLFEAELAMSIRHPNLIGTYDVGRDPETGLGYIIMEYVPGGTVRTRLDKWGALPIEEAADIVYRVAQALVAVNERHIVHRDVKPDNIMFAADGVTPKLADLGIARRSAGTTQNTTLTQSGYLIGSPAYMAPEQMLDSHRADIRADIHALGITFWEMLAGRRPYEGDDTMSIIARAMRGEAVPNVRTHRPDVPEGYAELIERMCCPNVARRVQSPEELVAELERVRLNPRETRAAIAARRAVHEHVVAQYGEGQGGKSVAIVAAAIVTALALTIAAVAVLVSTGRAGPVKERAAKHLAKVAAAVAEPAAKVLAATQTVAAAEGAAAGGAAAAAGWGAEEKEELTPVAENSKEPINMAGPVGAADGAGERPEWDELREPVQDEAYKYLELRRRVSLGEGSAEEEIRKAIDDAREIDPDLRAYDFAGKSELPWKKALGGEQAAKVRLGKTFLMMEVLTRDYPSSVEDYRREKKRLWELRNAVPADLTVDDMAAILGRAIGKDMFQWFRDFGLSVDAKNTKLSDMDGVEY